MMFLVVTHNELCLFHVFQSMYTLQKYTAELLSAKYILFSTEAECI